jgi:hypothetical protein
LIAVPNGDDRAAVMSNLRPFTGTSDANPSAERRRRMLRLLREAEGHEVPLKIQVGVTAPRNWRSTGDAVSADARTFAKYSIY